MAERILSVLAIDFLKFTKVITLIWYFYCSVIGEDSA